MNSPGLEFAAVQPTLKPPFDIRRRPPYPRILPKSKLREKLVSVCIAIGCDARTQNPKYILIADMSLSTVTSSTQYGVKFLPLGKGWFAMFAGQDVSLAPDIIADAARALARTRAENPGVNSKQVSEAIKNSYQTFRRTRITDLYLSSYQWTLEYFLQNGLSLLGSSDFTSLRYQIDQYDLQCSFLVCGFDNDKTKSPKLFQIDNPGYLTPRTITGGYAAIGSGASNAVSYLDWRKQSTLTSLAISVYNGIAAKSLAESALGVGPGTAVVICEKGRERWRILSDDERNGIKDIWLNEEAKVRPRNMESRLNKILGL